MAQMTAQFSNISIEPSLRVDLPVITSPVDGDGVVLPFDPSLVIPPADPRGIITGVQGRPQVEQPTVQLTAPYIPPAHVLEATSVRDMLDIRVPFDMNWTYEVGVAPVLFKLGILVGNKCIDNDLRIVMSYPAYLIPDSPFPLIIPPLTVYNIGFSLNETEAVNRVPSGNKLFAEEFTVTTTVLNVTGPVYVKPQL